MSRELEDPVQVTPDMLISEVLTRCPGAAEVFDRYHLHCGVCLAAAMEPLSAVASAHEIELDALIDDLNRELQFATGPKKES